jgi:hypothetical protein
MELPDILLVLIGLVMALAAFVIAVMNRRRDHALRDRFAEEQDRVLRGRDGRR